MVYLRSRLASFIRQRRGTMSQREFARRTGLAQSTIMRIENEDQNVTLLTLEQLCRAFRVDVAELFPRQPAPRSYQTGNRDRSRSAGLLHERRPEGSPVDKPETRKKHRK